MSEQYNTGVEENGAGGAAKSDQIESKDKISKRIFLGLFFMVIPLILVFWLIDLWPMEMPEAVTQDKGGSQVTGTTGQQPQNQDPAETGNKANKDEKDNKEPRWIKHTLLFKWEIAYELRLILIVLIAGGLGAYIHAATSFSSYIGNCRFKSSWYWWYWLRLPIGSIIALIFYMLVKGGLLIMQTQAATLRPFSVMGFAALTGMFSKQGVDKLNDIFNTLVKSDADKGRSDKLENEKKPEPQGDSQE